MFFSLILMLVDVWLCLGIKELDIYCNLHSLDLFVPVLLGEAFQVFKRNWVLRSKSLVTAAASALGETPKLSNTVTLVDCRGTALVVWDNSLDCQVEALVLFLYFPPNKRSLSLHATVAGAGGDVTQAPLWPPPLGLHWVRPEASTALVLPKAHGDHCLAIITVFKAQVLFSQRVVNPDMLVDHATRTCNKEMTELELELEFKLAPLNFRVPALNSHPESCSVAGLEALREKRHTCLSASHLCH